MLSHGLSHCKEVEIPSFQGRVLANPASLIGIPRLEPVHAGTKISFRSSALTALAQTLVEIDLANEADWTAAEENPLHTGRASAPPLSGRPWPTHHR